MTLSLPGLSARLAPRRTALGRRLTILMLILMLILAACRTSDPAPAASARDALHQLSVIERPAADPSYRRAAFGRAWADVDRDGCNTRDQVLFSTVDKTRPFETRRQGRCGTDMVAGTWTDLYTGRQMTWTNLKDPSPAELLPLDHIVSLAGAWRDGARDWTPQQRLQFANDPLELTSSTSAWWGGFLVGSVAAVTAGRRPGPLIGKKRTAGADQGCNSALRTETAALVEAAGYTPRDALVVGVQRADGPPEFVVSGRTPAGVLMGADTVVYTASLAKQVTATCAALLVQQGRLELESRLATWMPELPGWANEVQVRHLVSHTSGLPESTQYDELEHAGLDHTTAGVVGTLAGRDQLDHAPGTEHRYSNAGYVCLGLVVARAAGRPLVDVARGLVLDPLGLSNSRFWAGPAPHPPGAAPLDPAHPAPLSQGDGGFWSTAADLLRWNLAMNRDALGVSALVQTPGRLDDGTPLDYAWGVGVRKHAGRLLYRHGGRWAGLSAQLVRLADARSSFVVLALDDDEDRTVVLAQRMIDWLVG